MIRNALGARRWLVITGDCREILASVGDGEVDNVIADPPYDKMTHDAMGDAAASKSRQRTTGPTSRPNMLRIDFDPLDDVDGLVALQVRIAQRWVIDFCTMEMLGDYKRAAGDAWIRAGFWHRPDGMPQFSGDRPAQSGEGIAIMHRKKTRKRWNGGGNRAFWSYPIEHEDRVHPTQKPLPLMMKLVEQFTDPGELILDPYCGSGTTGVACLALDRRFVGVERDPKYADLARERCAAAEVGLTRQSFLAGQVPLL